MIWKIHPWIFDIVINLPIKLPCNLKSLQALLWRTWHPTRSALVFIYRDKNDAVMHVRSRLIFDIQNIISFHQKFLKWLMILKVEGCPTLLCTKSRKQFEISNDFEFNFNSYTLIYNRTNKSYQINVPREKLSF